MESNLLLICAQGALGINASYGEQQSVFLTSKESALATLVIDAEGQLFMTGHSL